MQIEPIHIWLAFIEGFALIISPCILPILPIILSGSLTGSKLRPFGIITGFIVTFTSVTLFSRFIVQYTYISQSTLRNFSFGILLLLGMVMMSTYLTDKFNFLTQRLSRVGSSLQVANHPQSGFLGGLLFGGLVGIIWTPCAGPILAAVIVQVVIQHTTYSSLFVVLAFTLGASLPMLLIAITGRSLVSRAGFLREKAVRLRQWLGLILILTVVYLAFPLDTSNASTNMENREAQTRPVQLIFAVDHPYKAPAIVGIDAWINSKPLDWNTLKGKVVLIDFWTYSCINCIRTLPHLKSWYAKYHHMGFEIIGVHSPEFQFEHELNNVRHAVVENGLLYPVALDNQFMTWQNFNNEYWPAHYLVNKDGDVVYVHFGEGEYEATENNIRYLLGLGNPMAAGQAENNPVVSQTPETYLGYRRSERYASPEIVSQNVPANYSFPKILPVGQWALNGKWRILSEKIISVGPGASIRIHFKASKVYIVMGASFPPVNLTVLLNGRLIATNSGHDVSNSRVQIIHHQLYSIVDLKKADEGVLDIIAINPGLEVYTFTFGP